MRQHDAITYILPVYEIKFLLQYTFYDKTIYVQESLSNNLLVPDYSDLSIRAIMLSIARHHSNNTSAHSGHSDHTNRIVKVFSP
jgi:hypothetical protein